MKPGGVASSSKRTSIAGVALVTVLLMVVGAAQAQPEPVVARGGPEIGESENPYEGAAAFAEMRAGFEAAAGTHPYVAAREQVERMVRANAVAPGAFARDWTFLGPSDVGGRVRALVVDPRNTNVLYAGGVSGGVWKSTDAGGSWVPLTETFANVGVSAIVIDPRDSNVLYVGTGEFIATRFSDSPLNGVGILKTTDAGATWRLLRATINNADFQVVHDLAISAADSNVLYASTTTGVSRSTDGGQTWQVVLQVDSESGCAEIALRTDRSPDVLLASCADFFPDGVYLSSDGGNTWAKVIDTVNGERAGRAAIAFAPSNQDIAYASVARTVDSPAGSSGTLALLRSDDGGQTWTVRNSGTTNWLGYCEDPAGQGYYGNVVAVDPTDPNRVWLGGVDMFRTDDAGQTVTIASYWWFSPEVTPPSPGMHADQHVITFDPGYDSANNQTIYFGNDGGVFRTRTSRAALPSNECYQPNNQVQYEPLNNGLAITQFWAGTVSNDGALLMGGTQDNGTWIRPSGAGADGWRWAIGGDGFDVAIAPANDRYYGEVYGHQGIRILRSSTGQVEDFIEVTKSSLNDSGLFFTPFVLDPSNPSVLWTGGHYMWRTTNGGDVWVQSSPEFTQGRRAVSAIGISPTDSNIIYAGSNAGDLWATTNGTASPPTWTQLPTQGGYVTAIAVHPADPRTAYATIGAFGLPHLLKTTDGGTTWTDIGTELPDVPFSAVAINPRNPDMVFVGTDAGAFESPNGGTTWFPANGNMASTIVQDLVFRPGTSELYLFTHGRGAYAVDVGTGG